VASASPHGEPRCGRLLVLIIGVYVVIIAFGESSIAGLIRVILLALTVLAAVRIRGAGGAWTALPAAGVVVALTAAAIATRRGSDRLSVCLVAAAVLLLVVAAMLMILVRLWRRPVADTQTVAGALTVYLLLALLFATLHQLFAALLGQPYLDGVPGIVDSARYLYFSVITLATVGYGDISPACGTARAVAMAEALVGQLYLVAVVGTVVGNMTGTRRRPSTTDGDDADR
jgi:hypothetical protein